MRLPAEHPTTAARSPPSRATSPAQSANYKRAIARTSTYGLDCQGGRSFIRFHQSPGWILRSEARASDLFPDYPEYKTPTLSYETHTNYLNTDNYMPFEAVS